MKNSIITILLIFALLPFVNAQHSKAVKLYERGQAALSRGNGEDAARLLRQAVEADSTFLEAHLLLAEWMLDVGHHDEALYHYGCVTRQNASFHTPAWLELANLQLAAGNYDDAVKSYKRFLELDKRAPKQHSEAERGISTALFRKNAIANPVPFNPTNLGSAINSSDDEYLPALTVDGETMVFTRRFARRASTTANTREEEDIFSSSLANGQWQKASPLPSPLNSTDNEGAECISQDGRIMFFTACGRQDGGGRCDIYMCIRRGDTWGKPRNIGMPVNSGAWEGQPSFSIDGKTLYFVSNRKGGFGGMDIWKTSFENGKWTEPVNLGPEINTAGNEMSPFIHYDDQTLYFASDGHIGMGGLDLFVARKTSQSTSSETGEQRSEKWSTPVNLGYPINTSDDESSLIVNATAHTAYFASDREGGFGKLDIYSFELPAPLRPTPTICYKGKVSDAKSGAPVGSDIRIVDLANGVTVANTSSDASSGQYAISLPTGRNYAFHVTAKGYLFHSINVNNSTTLPNAANTSESIKGSEQQLNITLNPITAGSHIALRNIFFETGKADLLPQSHYELGRLVELLQNNPTLSVELGGHTDNVGSAEANQKLSEARAKAVLDYLVKQGISPSRLSFRGYGESRPIATNDTPEGRADNRRVEMIVK